MRILRVTAVTGSLLALGAQYAVGAQELDSLRAQIARRVAEVPGAVVGVAFKDLGRGESVLLNADSMFHAASTMKLPVMIEVFRRADQKALRLDQQILLLNDYTSIVDGSPYSLNRLDDSDTTLYQRVGQRVSVRELLELMITRSSNLATNAVIELVGAQRVTATARALGAPNIQVLRGVEDGKAFQRGLNNTTSARDLWMLLEAIEKRRGASPESCNEMLRILEQQEFNDAIPAGLPPHTRVAHKTGNITAVLHDAAIVYPKDHAPYVLVVLTRGIPDERVARRLIVDVSRLVYAHVTGPR
jgi:beta-lactamase class A